MPMNLKAVAGAIKSIKTPLALKKGLLKKYGAQLKKMGSSVNPVSKSNPERKGNPAKYQKRKKNPAKKRITNPNRLNGILVPWTVKGVNYSDMKRPVKKRPVKRSNNPKSVKWYFGTSTANGDTVVFKSVGTPTERTHGSKYKDVTGPYTTYKKAYLDAHYHNNYGKVTKEANPAKGAVKIYDTLEAIEAQKGSDSCWPDEKFRHDFKTGSKASVYGLPNGDLLIKGNKPLWKNFNYPEKTKKK